MKGKKKKPKPKFDQINFVNKNFVSNIESLREFAKSLGPVVTERDDEEIKSFVKKVNKILKYALIESKTKAKKGEGKTEFDISNYQFKKLREAVFNIETPHSVILYEGTFMLLFTYFDGLISDLMHNYFRSFPKLLESGSVNLSLEELNLSKTVKEAKAYLISKHIEHLMYKNLEEQINYFEENLHIKCQEHIDWIKIAEAKERRNLLVHNNGLVSRRYLQRFKAKMYHPNNKSLKEGDLLSINNEYFNRTLDEILISGIIFGQECWRKWHPKDLESADTDLIERIYKLLLEKKWELAQRLSHYGRNSKVFNDAKQLIYDFNYCLCLKSLGKSEELNRELNNIDVSSLNPYLLLGYYALKKDASNFYKSLRNTLGAFDLEKELLLEWPIVQELRDDKNFRNNINRIYREAIPAST